MNQKDKWREEMLVMATNSMIKNGWSPGSFNDFDLSQRSYHSSIDWEDAYLEAKRSSQIEIDKINSEYALIMKSFCEKNDNEIQELGEMARQAIKHLETAYRWGLWYYENPIIYDEMEGGERDDLGNELDAVCKFLNSEEVFRAKEVK